MVGIIRLSLTEKLENSLRLLVSLSEHCLRSLLKNVELGVVDHFSSHISISDLRFCVCQVFVSCCKVVNQG